MKTQRRPVRLTYGAQLILVTLIVLGVVVTIFTVAGLVSNVLGLPADTP